MQEEHFLIDRYRNDLEDICKIHNQNLYDILTTSRKKEYNKPRIDCYLYLRLKGLPYQKIGDAFNKTHWAVITAIKRQLEVKELVNNKEMK